MRKLWVISQDAVEGIIQVQTHPPLSHVATFFFFFYYTVLSNLQFLVAFRCGIIRNVFIYYIKMN